MVHVRWLPTGPSVGNVWKGGGLRNEKIENVTACCFSCLFGVWNTAAVRVLTFENCFSRPWPCSYTFVHRQRRFTELLPQRLTRKQALILVGESPPKKVSQYVHPASHSKKVLPGGDGHFGHALRRNLSARTSRCCWSFVPLPRSPSLTLLIKIVVSEYF